MQSVKRIEIITDTLEMREVCRVLDEIGVSGYYVIRDVTGRGERGVQSGDDLTDVFKNSLLLTACPPERVSDIVTATHSGRPLLTMATPVTRPQAPTPSAMPTMSRAPRANSGWRIRAGQVGMV